MLYSHHRNLARLQIAPNFIILLDAAKSDYKNTLFDLPILHAFYRKHIAVHKELAEVSYFAICQEI